MVSGAGNDKRVVCLLTSRTRPGRPPTPPGTGTFTMHSAAIAPRPTPSHLSRASRLCSAGLLPIPIGNLPPCALELMLDHAHDAVHVDTHRVLDTDLKPALESADNALLRKRLSDNESAAAARATTHRPRTRPRLGTFSAGASWCVNTVWRASHVARNVLCSFCIEYAPCLDLGIVCQLVRRHCRHASQTWTLLGAGWSCLLQCSYAPFWATSFGAVGASHRAMSASRRWGWGGT